MVAATLLAAPATPAASKPYDIVVKDYTVETRHGRIYVEVAHPARNGEIVKAPAIFTYSPYSILGVPDRRNRDQNRWVPRGYARVWADMVGTGNSGGCYDYGGRREKQTGHDLVEWIGTRKWSTGKVAMIGGSYEGTTATATAVTNPRHLTTIVPEAAISRWYEYAYSGGIRYFLNNEHPTDEGFDTPAAFDFGLAVPPPLDVDDPTWGERFLSQSELCDELEHTEHGYDNTPDYGRFWLERDYVRKADNIDIPVLISHNWGDWNVKQEEAINLYRALDNSPNRKLYMGTRWAGHGTPGGTGSHYYKTIDAWMDHYLMGVDNGIEKMPRVHSMRSDYAGPLTQYAGRWPDTSTVKLWGQRVFTGAYQWKLLPSRPPRPGGEWAARYVSDGTNAELDANTAPHENLKWVFYQSPVLKRNVRIFGNIRVQIYSTVDRKWITYTPTIIDYDPSTNSAAMSPYGPVSVTRGWLDSRYRKSLAYRRPLKSPPRKFSMTVVEKPQDYTFRKGHRIGLVIQTEIVEWNIPKPYPCTTVECPRPRTHWQIGRTNVELPVVNAPSNPNRLFRR
jgi:X-Pro dipeptidyl-peptidase